MIKIALFTIFGVVTVAGALITVVWGPHARARRRLARGATQIADRELVTLTGTVRALAEPLVAPLSGKACVLYHASAFRPGDIYDNAAPNADHLVVEAMQPFELVTAAGVVLVDGTRADLAVRPAPVIPRVVARQVRFLTDHGRNFKTIDETEFVEATIEDGDRVRVQGVALVELDATAAAERGYRDAPATRVRVVAADGHPLTIGR